MCYSTQFDHNGIQQSWNCYGDGIKENTKAVCFTKAEDDAIFPYKAVSKENVIAFDLFAKQQEQLQPNGRTIINTGVMADLPIKTTAIIDKSPKHYDGFMWTTVQKKQTVDRDNRRHGNIQVEVQNNSNPTLIIDKGTCIAQLVDSSTISQ